MGNERVSQRRYTQTTPKWHASFVGQPFWQMKQAQNFATKWICLVCKFTMRIVLLMPNGQSGAIFYYVGQENYLPSRRNPLIYFECFVFIRHGWEIICDCNCLNADCADLCAANEWESKIMNFGLE